MEINTTWAFSGIAYKYILSHQNDTGTNQCSTTSIDGSLCFPVQPKPPLLLAAMRGRRAGVLLALRTREILRNETLY